MKKESMSKEKIDRIKANKPKKHIDVTRIEPIYTIKRLINEWKDRKHADRCVLINMELRNGQHDTFLVLEKEGGFDYEGGFYVFDDEFKYYNFNAKQYCYDYHQDCSLPIRRKINIKKLRDHMNMAEIDDVEFAINPVTLKKFLISKVIEMILRGAELDKWMRMMFWLALFTLIIVAIILLGDLNHWGVFQAISNSAKPPH